MWNAQLVSYWLVDAQVPQCFVTSFEDSSADCESSKYEADIQC